MAVDDVQQLLDLMALTPGITELSVQSSAGNRISIKKQLTAANFAAPSGYQITEHAADGTSDEVLLPEPSQPLVTINATMVGLFHSANPAVVPDSTVVPGQIVGYIESMRLMNEVVSNVEGTVEVVHTAEGQPVEYDQSLFSISAR